MSLKGLSSFGIFCSVTLSISVSIFCQSRKSCRICEGSSLDGVGMKFNPLFNRFSPAGVSL